MKKTFNASRKVGKSFLEPSLTSQCFLGKAFCTTTQLVEAIATIRFFYFFCSSIHNFDGYSTALTCELKTKQLSKSYLLYYLASPEESVKI